MSDLLLICPANDRIERAMRQWAMDLGYSAVQAGTHTWRSLEGPQVTRANVEAALARDPAAVFFYGHGEVDRWLAGGITAVVDCLNASRLAGTLVFAVACDSARLLGPAAVQAGARAYVGYEYPFVFPFDAFQTSFRQGANAPQLAVLRGRACQSAVVEAKAVYEAAADGLVRGPQRNDYAAMFAAGWLRSNAAALELLGDRTAAL